MTDPIPVTPLQYQTPSQISNDLGHLKALSICHYVWGGLSLAFSSIFIVYIVLGAVMASGAMNSPSPPVAGPPPTVGPGSPYVSRSGSFTTTPATTTAGPPQELGYLFIGIGTCAVTVGWAMGICTIVSGRKMTRHRSRMFSIVIAGINCMSFPLGTLLGVFTIVVLSRQSVKQLYDAGM